MAVLRKMYPRLSSRAADCPRLLRPVDRPFDQTVDQAVPQGFVPVFTSPAPCDMGAGRRLGPSAGRVVMGTHDGGIDSDVPRLPQPAIADRRELPQAFPL
ncbi:hypothetical protein [Streptomyces reniochalinae]|uniref:hypothetical protein n=1 Tax=Streptomyces reniochalinae TaxID=2250578 RepID=UPI001FE995A8|nr:hypothetical protein [Streptomyces reniochalinae]